MQSEDMVGVVAILVVFGLPLGYAIVSRFFAHQERMAMIQRGVMPPPDARWAKNMQGAPPQQNWDAYYYGEWRAQRSLRKGITLSMIGFALLIGLSFINPHEPGPWLLGGLIPLFVGIAQIISAVLSGARFGNFGPAAPPPGQQAYQQQPPPPFGSPRDVPPGPYAWRPGPTTELEQPLKPPDKR